MDVPTRLVCRALNKTISLTAYSARCVVQSNLHFPLNARYISGNDDGALVRGYCDLRLLMPAAAAAAAAVAMRPRLNPTTSRPLTSNASLPIGSQFQTHVR